MRYLLLTYVRRPGGKIDESMAVSNRVRDRDLSTANVILDFRHQSVLKCSMDGKTVPKNWERIVSYYYQHYAATIERLFEENGHANPMEKSGSPDPS